MRYITAFAILVAGIIVITVMMHYYPVPILMWAK